MGVVLCGMGVWSFPLCPSGHEPSCAAHQASIFRRVRTVMSWLSRPATQTLSVLRPTRISRARVVRGRRPAKRRKRRRRAAW